MNQLQRKIIGAATFLISISANAADTTRWIEVKNGAWNPSVDVVNEMKSRIVNFVENDNDANNESGQKNIKDLKKRWNSYTVQYQGQKQNGKDIIFINALCKAKGPSLQQYFWRIHDGGSCYFFLSYDPLKKRFFNLWINGEA